MGVDRHRVPIVDDSDGLSSEQRQQLAKESFDRNLFARARMTVIRHSCRLFIFQPIVHPFVCTG